MTVSITAHAFKNQHCWEMCRSYKFAWRRYGSVHSSSYPPLLSSLDTPLVDIVEQTK